MTRPVCLLVDPTPRERALLVEVEDTVEVRFADLRGEVLPEPVDVVVVGSSGRAAEHAPAVLAVQAAHRRCAGAGILVVLPEEGEEALRRAIRYAPGVPLELSLRPADQALAGHVRELRDAAAERRRHEAVLAALASRTTTPAARPAAVAGLGALLDHAPLGVLVCEPDGTLVGWNRRAATLLRLADGEGAALDAVLPGGSRLLAAAFPWLAAPRATSPSDEPPAGSSSDSSGSSATGSAGTDAPQKERAEPGETVALTAAGGTELEVGAVPSQLDDGRLVALVSMVDVTERRRAERAQQRLSGHVALLTRVSESLARTLDIEETLSRLAAELVPAVADWVSLQLTDEADRLTTVVMRHRDPAMADVLEQVRRLQLRTSSAAAPSRRAARGEGPLLHRHVDETLLAEMVPDPQLRAAASQLGVGSLVAVPLPGRYAVHGALVLVNGPQSGPLSDDDVTLATEVGRRAALALDNARLYQQQWDLARELQSSLLTPPPRPALGIIEVRYEAAAHEAQVGGDWYDAFLQPDGTTVLVIGDVIGHDVKAAAGMSQLRGVLRGIGHTTGARPAEILRRTDEADEGLLMRALATVLVATLSRPRPDSTDVEVCWSSAGHPPPVVVRPDGRVGVPSGRQRGGVQPDLLLGVDATAERHDHSTVLPAGSTLLLYTDGLVERRGEDLDEGISRLIGVLRDRVGLGLAELCDEVLGAMLPDDPEDDVALVAIRVSGEPVAADRSL